MEALNVRWLTAPDEPGRMAVSAEKHALTLRDEPTTPLGLFFIRTAYRRNLTELLEALRPVPSGLCRA